MGLFICLWLHYPSYQYCTINTLSLQDWVPYAVLRAAKVSKDFDGMGDSLVVKGLPFMLRV